MSDEKTYYVKEGKEYKCVGKPTPKFLSDGVWIVDCKCKNVQHIAKIGELKNPFPYAQMFCDCSTLANYIRVRFMQYYSDSLKIQANGALKFCLPCTTDIAADILKFLSKTNPEKHHDIEVARLAAKHIDDSNNVVDGNGKLLYRNWTKEATAVKLKELRKEVEEWERILGERCMDSL